MANGKLNQSSIERKDESVLKSLLESAWATIEEITNKIACIFWTTDKELHDQKNWV